MSDPEKKLINESMIDASKRGDRLFRNNTGMGWAGKSEKIKKAMKVFVNHGDVIVRNAYPLRAGLINGSSDTIGWTRITITQEMVGKTVPIFTAPEMKTGRKKPTPEQLIFLNNVKEVNGIAPVVYKIEDITKEIERWKIEMNQ